MGVSAVCLLGHAVQFRLFNSVMLMTLLRGPTAAVCDVPPVRLLSEMSPVNSTHRRVLRQSLKLDEGFQTAIMAKAPR